MLIDDVTLTDLEVVRSLDGSEGIFALIDRTRTSVGRRSLGRRLKRPSSDIEQIRETQVAVRFLREHGHVVDFDERSIRPVLHYLRSNIELAADSRVGARVEQAWLAIRYRDLLKEIRDGQAATEALCRHLCAICLRLADRTPPPVIADFAASLHETASSVLDTLGSENTVLADRRLRGVLKGPILDAIQTIGELDALASMAASGAELGWCTPTLVESQNFIFEAQGVFHPFVADPVSNPVELSGGEPVVFLTGPNMAGKTTYLRSVALVVLLAQAGMDVPATSARLTPVEALFTSLNPSDNLKAGLSYFLAEVMRVKVAATLLAEGKRSLVLFDEVFKGTNVKDALEASAEVILGFARARNSGFMFASHLAELAHSLDSNPAIRFCYFDGEILQGSPSYSYALKDGVSDKRFGLLLLRRAEIPELMARISA
jgi:DNA mismatch repair ATPase MutS